MWGELICKRQSSRRFYLVETRLTEATSIVCYYSAHPTYLESIFVYTDGCLSNPSCADHFTFIKYNHYYVVSFCSERKDQRKHPG